MDTEDRPISAPSREAFTGKGGMVEPVRQRTPQREAAPAEVQAAPQAERERYELRDPTAELTYRSGDFATLQAKAEQIGSTRIVAIDAEGRRTAIDKVGDRWERGVPRPALREPEAMQATAEAPERTPGNRETRTNVVPLPTAPSRAASTTERSPAPDPRSETLAERSAQVERLETALRDRYVIKRALVKLADVPIGHTEYRYRGNTTRVAFTESAFRLATDSNNPSVARSMVDVAEARNWKALRVTGHEEFRRQVWFEASLRGVRTLGYEPMPSDLAWLRSEQAARQVNRIEPSRAEIAPGNGMLSSSGDVGSAAAKTSTRGGGGRKAVLAAIEAVLVAKGVPEKQRSAVMAAATEKLAERMRNGQVPKVKVYDKAAPSQRQIAVPAPELQRSHDRATPTPVR